MSEVAKAVKPLFDKFIDFFDIFDLSFFVSGATFVAAIAWARLTPDLELLLGFNQSAPVEGLVEGVPGVGVIVLVLASYIAGMTCFAAGRFVRKWLYRAIDGYDRKRGKRPPSDLYAELASHGMIARAAEGAGWEVTDHGRRLGWLPRYFADGGRGQESALYVRMWAEVRQREIFAPSFSLLRRYWVSSATLDGLFVALSTWAALLALVQQAEHGWIPSVVTFGGALFCLREARRYGEYQREELVATLLLGYDMPELEGSTATAPTAAPAEAVSFAVDAGAAESSTPPV
ncbi:MAG: hypothetical protein R6X02_05135 [Enhygromyxa sp.]